MPTQEQTPGIEPTEGRRGRELGGWEGLVAAHADFDVLPDELAEAFAGEHS